MEPIEQVKIELVDTVPAQHWVDLANYWQKKYFQQRAETKAVKVKLSQINDIIQNETNGVKAITLERS